MSKQTAIQWTDDRQAWQHFLTKCTYLHVDRLPFSQSQRINTNEKNAKANLNLI